MEPLDALQCRGNGLRPAPARKRMLVRRKRTPGRTWTRGLLLVAVLHGCGGDYQRGVGDGRLLQGDGVVKVQFERSGGFAGMKRAVTVDTRSMPPEQAEELKDRVSRADFFNLPPEIIGQKGADQFLYILTIEAGGQRHTVRTTDTAAPEGLRPLIEWLNRQAR
jgi:hypothetical protein